MGTGTSDNFFTRALLHRSVLLGAIWLALVAGDTQGILVGLVIVPLAIWLSLALVPARNPLDLWRLALHLPRFVAGSVAGGVDVARRAFAPAMPLSPDWVRVKVALPDGARAALGAEISLMPGTLAAGADEDGLLVHLLTSDDDRAASEIAAIEAQIAAMIEASGTSRERSAL
ncbi:MAG: Na+/H+ antiporter subunit E [Erythrobacter sp.]